MNKPEVHPHGCGENSPGRAASRWRPGPSPRVWGKQLQAPTPISGDRSIPTGVGKTSVSPPSSWILSVHPHGCGENLSNGGLSWISCGPSPRVWGKLARPIPAARRNRSIPTGVGKTRSSGRFRSAPKVHPHGCGENATCVFRDFICRGPSPRVWGKRVRGLAPRVRGRSIPTGVGKTAVIAVPVSAWTVHPHGCGENWAQRRRYKRPNGPSPRVWGKHLSKNSKWTSYRSIPTGVGKTYLYVNTYC